ncbi:MAG: hypothetical protein ACK481_05800 [Candidatus Melainabacteria bacterium]|jgi:hypothetical protein
MFQSIVFKNKIDPGVLIDAGALAEALIFYENVSIVANTATIEDLLKQIPPSEVLSLIRSERLKIYYLNDQIGVSTKNIKTSRSNYDEHSLVCFSSPNHTIETVAKRLKEAVGDTGKLSSDARKIAQLLHPIDHADFDQRSLIRIINDEEFIESSVRGILGVVVPKYKLHSSFNFRIEQENEEQFCINTNLDFKEINIHYRQIVPIEHSTLSPAYIVNLIQESYESLYFAATIGAEMATSSISNVIQEQAIQSMTIKHTNSLKNLGSFISLVLPNANAIREAINSKKVSWVEFQHLLDKADKFRSWIQNQSPDDELIRNYYQETVKETWADKLPGKPIKWAMFTGVGILVDALTSSMGLGSLGGIAFSAADTFILDKIIKGWKPHQFIEKDLKLLFDSK